MREIPNILRNIAGNFFPAIGGTGVISVRSQLPLSFVVFCSYIMVIVCFVSVLCNYTAAPLATTERPLPINCLWLVNILLCEVPRDIKIILGFPPRKERVLESIP